MSFFAPPFNYRRSHSVSKFLCLGWLLRQSPAIASPPYGRSNSDRTVQYSLCSTVQHNLPLPLTVRPFPSGAAHRSNNHQKTKSADQQECDELTLKIFYAQSIDPTSLFPTINRESIISPTIATLSKRYRPTTELLLQHPNTNHDGCSSRVWG